MSEMAARGPSTDPGDDSVVLRVHLHWLHSVPEVMTSAGPPVGHVGRDQDGAWQLVFAVQRLPTRRQRHFVSVDPDRVRPNRWWMLKLGPGVWDIPQSIFFEGQIHAFVTLVGVPDPAPWET